MNTPVTGLALLGVFLIAVTSTAGDTLVAAATPFTFNVVPKPTKLDTESWDYVSQNGTADEVVAMINRENVHALDLEKDF